MIARRSMSVSEMGEALCNLVRVGVIEAAGDPAVGEEDDAVCVCRCSRVVGNHRDGLAVGQDRKSTRLNSSHSQISYAVFCLKKKTTNCQLSQYSYHRSTRTMHPVRKDPPIMWDSAASVPTLGLTRQDMVIRLRGPIPQHSHP